MIALRRDGGRLSFSVRVTPRASANVVAGERDGVLLVRVTAAPADGAANRAVVALLAKALDVAPSTVEIQAGAAARTKRVSVPAAAEARLTRVVK
ncbi:MAG TPA: DUF167 domain-containing protein [Candidatus Acidoferrales bacterium]|nr:DUF167 domain-containing protein [Candidatus Acidoferrales bacterium]